MNKRILVLDDDLAILEAISNILEYSGYNVRAFDRGDRILEKIDDYHPDLILLDVMLAGLDGRDICRDIKAEQKTERIPVILISATHNFSSCILPKGGPDGFIDKPFDINYLLNEIENLIASAA